MNRRYVFIASDLDQAAAALDLLRARQIDDAQISLVARSDIEIKSIPDEYRMADTDFKQAAVRGAGVGAVAGTLAGLAAATFPPLGLTLAGAMLGGGTAGALMGTWTSAMVGASMPDPVRQRFEEQLAQGRVLVVVDMPADDEAGAAAALTAAGLQQMQYESTLAATG